MSSVILKLLLANINSNTHGQVKCIFGIVHREHTAKNYRNANKTLQHITIQHIEDFVPKFSSKMQ